MKVHASVLSLVGVLFFIIAYDSLLHKFILLLNCYYYFRSLSDSFFFILSFYRITEYFTNLMIIFHGYYVSASEVSVGIVLTLLFNIISTTLLLTGSSIPPGVFNWAVAAFSAMGAVLLLCYTERRVRSQMDEDERR